ncbi:MAG: exodeoxyribonuclease VII large subunit [Sedimentisphaerales bacterium]|nr:exodeoxyribonuclease VII large subunit [Sedimentisphaerales bacterium]
MQNKARIYTVGQVNLLVKVALEERLPSRLTVRGEISDWKLHKESGHCYFSLKDEDGVLPCVMWASSFRGVKFAPEDGMAVLATGHIDVYVAGGKYQLYVDKLEPEGVGALQLAFEQMVRKLAAEGLFDDAHKKPLPAYPMRIGILTSESGAAIEDIKDSIWNRWPCAKLFLCPVPVQGEGAAQKIAAALRDVNRRNSKLKLDVLIVGRGGGSPEDLWAFNEEVLARAIFDSQIPVISAVGHEIDTTIADLVADARASTPTKAGVVAVPDIQEVLGRLGHFERRLTSELRSNFELCRGRLETILASWVFQKPMSIVFYAGQRLDEVESQLEDVMRELLGRARERVTACREQVVKIEPHRLLGRKMVELNNWQNMANSAIKGIINSCQMRLTAAANRLAALNPKSVLQRGYSITTNKKTGMVVRDLGGVEIGDSLITELARENLIESKVTKK